MPGLTSVSRFVLLLLCFLRFSNIVYSQNGIVSGLVKEEGDKPIANANVLLLRSADSLLVKGTISDSSGKFSFTNVQNGSYHITVSHTGKQQLATKPFFISAEKERLDLGALYLQTTSGNLSDVTITARRAMFEQKIDRLIINVKNSIANATGTALDILEKSPGVAVNRQTNTIGINGKNGVSVMINGKISYMPAEALIQLLSGIPAENIERIELITSPPAKYDAEGNAGYINIVLINNPYTGLSGSWFLTAGYAKRENGAAGINFNYREGRVNLYGNFTFNHDRYIQPGRGFTRFPKSGDIITNTSFTDRDAKRQVYNARIGIDYQIDSSNIIGALVSGYINRWTMIAHNGATISTNDVVDTIITTVNNPEMNLWKNIMTNLNFQHTFKPGQLLFFDLNYIYYKDDNPNNYYTQYFNGAKEFLFNERSRSGKITPINFRVVSSDYTTLIGKKITMDAGLKLSLSRFKNNISADNLRQGIWVRDENFSANYLLKEDITAVYASISIKPNNKTSITAGLRYEYTVSNLGTTKRANIVDRKYGELFPTFSLSNKIDGDNAINFSYGRRITRPTFNDLAPFTVFFDPKTFFSGDPSLQPAIANSLQASYVFKNYNFTLSYTYEVSTIDNFYFQTQRIDTVNNLLYLSSRNFKNSQYMTASISLPVSVNDWWTMQNNFIGNWQQINTAHDTRPVLLENFDYSINSTQRFVISKDVSAELTGFYSSSAFLGTAKRKPLHRLDIGIQKKIGQKKDILRLVVNDLFNSGGYYRFSETLPINGAIVSRSFNFGNVACRLTYTHNFGNSALKGKRERRTGAEDELKRVNN